MAVELEMKGNNQFTVHYANSPPPTVAEERFNRSGFDNFDLVLAEVLQSQVLFLLIVSLQIVPFWDDLLVKNNPNF